MDGTGQRKWRPQVEEGWGPGARRRALLGALACCAREKKEGEGRKKKEGKRKGEKEKENGEEKEREEKRERDAAGFAEAVDARGGGRSEATCTRNEEKGNAGMGIEFGCRNSGSSEKDFGKSGAWTAKNLE